MTGLDGTETNEEREKFMTETSASASVRPLHQSKPFEIVNEFEYENIHPRLLKRFPQGGPGTRIERCGRIYVVNEKGEQRRVK